MAINETVVVTKKIKRDLAKISDKHGVRQEAFVNVGLRLLLSNEQDLKTLINLIHSAKLGGATDLENKGW